MTMTEQQAEELASQLSETLALHYPEGCPTHIYNEELVKRWLGELTQFVAESSDPKDEDRGRMVNQVVRLAVQRWKERGPSSIVAPATAVAKSFSLFDQLSAMPRRIFYDEIEAASSSSEQLLLLQQVDHVDDVASDWTNVLDLLFVGLTEGDYTSEFLELHRKWFEQCASTAENTSLRYGLCSNVVKALRHCFGHCVHVAHTEGLSFDNLQQHAFATIQLWHSMWMSAVAEFRADDSHQMAFEIMGLMRNLSTSSPAGFVFLPAHLTALVDPYADWFAYWIRHDVSPADAVNELLSSGLLYDLMQRCSDRGHIEWKHHDGDSLNEINIITIQEGDHAQVPQLERALFVHSLCMVRSILVCSRVGLFPWDELRREMPKQVPYTRLLASEMPREQSYTPGVPCVSEVLSVINPFVDVLQLASTEARLASICTEAIETILWGLQNERIFRDVIQTLLDHFMEMPPSQTSVSEGLFAVIAREFFGRDWTLDKGTQGRILNFLRVLWEQCHLGSGDFEFISFEKTLLEYSR